jgi:threonine dehydrogenase-like Zn-dependent dehydrogenase
MFRATMTSPGKIEFSEVPMPVLGDHDVLLRIRRIGICGSDIHVYHGKHPYTSYPVVQGHEFCGEVAAVGLNVQSFRPGDLATAPPQIVCGECVPCREGRYHICENLKVMGCLGVVRQPLKLVTSAVAAFLLATSTLPIDGLFDLQQCSNVLGGPEPIPYSTNQNGLWCLQLACRNPLL